MYHIKLGQINTRKIIRRENLIWFHSVITGIWSWSGLHQSIQRRTTDSTPGIRFPVTTIDLYLRHSIQTGSEVYPAPQPICTGILPCRQRGRGVELFTQFHAGLRSGFPFTSSCRGALLFKHNNNLDRNGTVWSSIMLWPAMGFKVMGGLFRLRYVTTVGFLLFIIT
jgi:hypothetical protein